MYGLILMELTIFNLLFHRPSRPCFYLVNSHFHVKFSPHTFMTGLVLGYLLFVAIANVIFSPSYVPSD